MGTLAEQLIQRGMLKGRTEGIREGLVKGLQEGLVKGIQEGLVKGIQEGLNGQREVLARQLAFKFGVLPGSAEERIARATREQKADCDQLRGGLPLRHLGDRHADPQREKDLAVAALGWLPASKYRDALVTLADFAVARTY